MRKQQQMSVMVHLILDPTVTPEELQSLSKTTKLLLLDSLLQEVCIESGSDGSLSLSSLGMSVRLVSHNLLYSGLKKAHLKMRTKTQ